MKHSHAVMASALAVGLALAAPARAAENAAPGKIDRDFMNEAASAGLMEVELGRYAAAHAASDRVKQFGQQMAADHAKANDELKQVAAQNDVELPAKMSAKDRAAADRLMKLKGAAFDRAYMQEMVTDHQKVVGKFRDQSRSAQDPAVKQFATTMLPTLERHLEMAKEIEASGGHTTSGAGARRH
jgi:putative membrane protein